MNSKKVLITILSSIAIFWLLLKFWFPDFYLLKRKPSLIRGLSSEIAVAEEQFALKVKKLFPPNTPNTEIERELSNQGFEIKTVREKKIASFEMHNVFCRLEYLIDWEVNDKNKIYNLRGDHNAVCL